MANISDIRDSSEIRVERSEVAITENDLEGIFTWEERRIHVVHNYSYTKTVTYDIDCGDHAGTEDVDYEYDVDFTPKELMEYYVKQINGLNFKRHNNHDQIMVAGKFYKNLWDTKIEQIIQHKMKELRTYKVKLWEQEQARKAKFQREVSMQELYRTDLKDIANNLEQIIRTILNRELEEDYLAFKVQHTEGTMMLDTMIKEASAKTTVARALFKHRDELIAHIRSTYKAYGNSRVALEEVRASLEFNRRWEREIDTLVWEFRSLEREASELKKSHMTFVDPTLCMGKVSTYNKQHAQIMAAIKGHITEEVHKNWTTFAQTLAQTNSWSKYGWGPYDNTVIVNLRERSIWCKPMLDLTEYVKTVKAKVTAKAYRISAEGRFRRWVMWQNLTQPQTQ